MSVENNMHIAYVLHDKSGKYCKILAASIYSLLCNSSENICIHLLHDGTLKDNDTLKFVNMIKTLGHEIKCYNMENIVDGCHKKICESIHPIWIELFTPAVFYRMWVWEVLPIDVSKVIIIDADTIINMDIAELWNLSTGDNGLAAVLDPNITIINNSKLCQNGIINKNRYFNAGLLVIDRQKFNLSRELWNEMMLTFFSVYSNSDYPEQDMLNYYFNENCKLLDEKYNTIVEWQRYNKINKIENKIYHYSNKSIDIVAFDEYTKLFFKYFMQTPWCDEYFMKK